MELSKKLAKLSQSPSAVYVGDCGVDWYKGEVFPGGCALNTAYYAKREGLDIDLVSCVGSDQVSAVSLGICKDVGLNSEHVHRLNGLTPTQQIEVQPDGEKFFVKYKAGVLKDFLLSEGDISFIKKHDILITLFYRQISHLFNQVVSIDFTGVKVVNFMDMTDFGKKLSFVKQNLSWLDIGVFGLATEDQFLIERLGTLANDSGKLFLFTLGAGGSEVIWNNKTFYQEAKDVDVVDTTGCGDAYLAGFLATLVKTKNIQEAMVVGSKLASDVAGNLGAIP